MGSSNIPSGPALLAPRVRALASCLGIALLLSTAGAGPAQEPDLKKPYASEYALSFKGVAGLTPGWKFEGPGAEKCLKFEPAGLRLTLPLGWKNFRPSTGAQTPLVVKGDFEIILSFEILEAPAQADTGIGTRLSLGIFKDTPKANVATISRSVSAQSGEVVVAWTSLWKEDGEKPFERSSGMPTTAKIGRLCLVRTSGDLHFGFAEGLEQEIQFKKKFPFGTEDLRTVRIAGSTGGPDAKLDARVMDLRIRADAIPNQPAPLPTELAQKGTVNPVAETPEAGGRIGLVTSLAAAGLLALLSVAGVGGWLLLRRRRNSSAPAPAHATANSLAVACASCGKKLKIKPELAGKKVKCSQCGKPVLVPSE